MSDRKYKMVWKKHEFGSIPFTIVTIGKIKDGHEFPVIDFDMQNEAYITQWGKVHHKIKATDVVDYELKNVTTMQELYEKHPEYFI